ncbi:regulatory protein RecX [Tanacetum coccineum]
MEPEKPGALIKVNEEEAAEHMWREIYDDQEKEETEKKRNRTPSPPPIPPPENYGKVRRTFEQDMKMLEERWEKEAAVRKNKKKNIGSLRLEKKACVKKGVNDSSAPIAIKSVLEGGESGGHQISRLGFSNASVDHLVTQASKQWLNAKDLPSEKQKSRIITWLRYHGFIPGTISVILKKLQSELPPYG